MGDVRHFPRRQLVLVDERGVSMRVTWHEQYELLVLSVWHDDRCTGSFRLSVADAPQLAGMLSAAVGDWAAAVLATRPEPAILAQAVGDRPARPRARLAALLTRIRPRRRRP
ncbi:MAG TPA: hypothetical protein VKG45_08990 [Actinomycetes bacterium]|nr:hypothetical protein [Actinomycetes bacterium]